MSDAAVIDRLTRTRQATDDIRRRRKAMQRAKTEISIHTNNPDGTPGLVHRGHVDVNDVVRHDWPMKKNISSSGYFKVRASHPMAKLIAKIPNNPEECKNVIVRVDRYGGAWRWTGMMHHWTVETVDGVDYLTASFNDDMQIWQFCLGPPNPLLPLQIFQGPRDYFSFGPGVWCSSIFLLLNMLRNQVDSAFVAALTLPDDPFDFASWGTGVIDSLLPADWPVHVKCPNFLLDSSLWTFIASRMNTADTVIDDTLDNGQLALRYRRIFSAEGETVTGLLDNNIANGACVFEITDESQFSIGGTFTSGTVIGGLERTVLTWIDGGLTQVLSAVADNETLYPDEYWQSGFLGSFASAPTVGIEDSWFNDLQSKVTHSPATAPKVVAGGDNPTADAIAKLIIEAIGNLIGYFLLGGFDSL